MLIYRYEKKDGGGPYCDFNGYLRTDSSCHMNDSYLYGCTSLSQLTQYFQNQ